MIEPVRFPFIERAKGKGRFLPYMPLTLIYGDKSASVMGLLDTGATVNVLPFQIGNELGAVWEQQDVVVKLTGNFARSRLFFEVRPKP